MKLDGKCKLKTNNTIQRFVRPFLEENRMHMNKKIELSYYIKTGLSAIVLFSLIVYMVKSTTCFQLVIDHRIIFDSPLCVRSTCGITINGIGIGWSVRKQEAVWVPDTLCTSCICFKISRERFFCKMKTSLLVHLKQIYCKWDL